MKDRCRIQKMQSVPRLLASIVVPALDAASDAALALLYCEVVKEDSMCYSEAMLFQDYSTQHITSTNKGIKQRLIKNVCNLHSSNRKYIK